MLSVLERFSQEEQRGFARGGNTYVRASVITIREDKTSRTFRETQDERNERQERAIEEFVHQNET